MSKHKKASSAAKSGLRFDPAQDFDHAAPCPFCASTYLMLAPDGADVSGGVGLPAFIGHLRQAHPEVLLVDAAYDLVGAARPDPKAEESAAAETEEQSGA